MSSVHEQPILNAEQLTQVQEHIVSLQGNIEEKAATINDLQLKVHHLEARSDDLLGQLDSSEVARSELEETIDSQKAELLEHQKELKNLHSQLKEKTITISEMQTSIEEQEALNSEDSEKLSLLQSTITDLNDEVKSLNGDIGAKKSEIFKLEKELNRLESSSEEQVTLLNGRVENLTASLQVAHDEITSKAEQIKQLKAVLSERADTIDEQAGKISELQRASSPDASGRDSGVATPPTLDTSITLADEMTVQTQTDEIRALKEELEKTKTQLAAANKANAAFQKSSTCDMTKFGLAALGGFVVSGLTAYAIK